LEGTSAGTPKTCGFLDQIFPDTNPLKVSQPGFHIFHKDLNLLVVFKQQAFCLLTMVLEYLPTFTPKINQFCRVNIPHMEHLQLQMGIRQHQSIGMTDR